jgi:hypothetical protein
MGKLISHLFLWGGILKLDKKAGAAMKILFGFLLVILLSLNVYGMPVSPFAFEYRTIPPQRNSAAQPDGFYREYYENGYMKSKVSYKNGRLDGRSLIFYPNGHLKKQVNYKQGVLQGKAFEFYENGQYKIEANYQQGKADGPVMFFYENGNLHSIIVYKDGQKVKETVLNDMSLAAAR